MEEVTVHLVYHTLFSHFGLIFDKLIKMWYNVTRLRLYLPHFKP